MNVISIGEKPKAMPLGMLSAGRMFVPKGRPDIAYMVIGGGDKPQRARVDDVAIVQLGNGILYWEDKDQKVIPVPLGGEVCLVYIKE